MSSVPWTVPFNHSCVVGHAKMVRNHRPAISREPGLAYSAPHAFLYPSDGSLDDAIRLRSTRCGSVVRPFLLLCREEQFFGVIAVEPFYAFRRADEVAQSVVGIDVATVSLGIMPNITRRSIK